jgi:hypothetical protein
MKRVGEICLNAPLSLSGCWNNIVCCTVCVVLPSETSESCRIIKML